MASSQRHEKQDNLILLASRKQLATSGTTNVLVTATGRSSKTRQVSFNRQELNILLHIYSMKVASGEWRDYAIDCLIGRAIFSVFKKARQTPLFQIEKDPKLTNRQGAYSIVCQKGGVIKRGHDLSKLVKILEKKKLYIIEQSRS